MSQPPPLSDHGTRSTVHILVVEDERAIQKMLKLSLERVGHQVSSARTGAEALHRIRHEPIELILLDILLPDMSGFDVCRDIRRFSDVPVVMLTALNRTEDIVQGFSLGADDYITKPFSLREVQGRIDAILRRIRWIEARPLSDHYALNGVTLNERMQTVVVRDKDIHLTPIEFRLLRYLLHRPDRPISKEELFAEVWGYELVGGTNLVEVAIRRLRSKIEEDPSKPALIVTVHTVGYKFVGHVGAVEL
jgi:DNA-binding response OmpR family regulator